MHWFLSVSWPSRCLYFDNRMESLPLLISHPRNLSHGRRKFDNIFDSSKRRYQVFELVAMITCIVSADGNLNYGSLDESEMMKVGDMLSY